MFQILLKLVTCLFRGDTSDPDPSFADPSFASFVGYQKKDWQYHLEQQVLTSRPTLISHILYCTPPAAVWSKDFHQTEFLQFKAMDFLFMKNNR